MKPKNIGTISFKGIDVGIYYDSDLKEKIGTAIWQARNPESFYQGLAYMNNEGKVTYPEDAIIPEQTDYDREILPKFIIIGQEQLDDKFEKLIYRYMDSEFLRRNSKNEI